MRKVIVLLNISIAGRTSGVERYLDNLTTGLQEYQDYHVVRVNFWGGNKILFPFITKVSSLLTLVDIPLPQNFGILVHSSYWMQQYCAQAYTFLAPLLSNTSINILHVHTLNLIDFALFIKKHHPSRIITHLHCITWKNYYNTNRPLFNHIYKKIYIDKDYSIPFSQLCTNRSELIAYTKSDKIICVTSCASSFLYNLFHIQRDKIYVIDNGMEDWNKSGLVTMKKKDVPSILFVGSFTDSKGLDYVLDAIEKVDANGYSVNLIVAGKIFPRKRELFEKHYKHLTVNYLDNIPLEALTYYYKNSDIGIIGSLQEQCSYAAIEMAMWAMPIITTNVDGLDEIFDDGINALKVPTVFSLMEGLSVDTDLMSKYVIKLITNPRLQYMLKKNARALYCKRFSLNKMLEETTNLYNSMFE